MKIRLANPLQVESIVDGPGFRAVVWTQGCTHNCKGCHNPHTHDLNKGKLYDIEDIKKDIRELKLHKGLTLSGGEPFLQAKECLELVKEARLNNLNIWCYSGFTFEYLKDNASSDMKALLSEIDVLIDGKFELDKRDLMLDYKGSSNQRLVDVKVSLKQNKVVELPI